MTLRTVSSEIPALQRHLVVHEDLLERRFVGPVDQLTVDGVLALFPQLPSWPVTLGERNSRIRGATTILTWLLNSSGKGWQDRWIASGADNDLIARAQFDAGVNAAGFRRLHINHSFQHTARAPVRIVTTTTTRLPGTHRCIVRVDRSATSTRAGSRRRTAIHSGSSTSPSCGSAASAAGCS